MSGAGQLAYDQLPGAVPDFEYTDVEAVFTDSAYCKTLSTLLFGALRAQGRFSNFSLCIRVPPSFAREVHRKGGCVH